MLEFTISETDAPGKMLVYAEEGEDVGVSMLLSGGNVQAETEVRIQTQVSNHNYEMPMVVELRQQNVNTQEWEVITSEEMSREGLIELNGTAINSTPFKLVFSAGGYSNASFDVHGVDYYILDVVTHSYTYIECNRDQDAEVKDYRFGFNGQEKDNEMKGVGNSIDLGARILDTRIGIILTIDPAAREYPSVSPYSFVLNNPINAIDPDGKRVYFVAGAGLDSDGWNYTERWGKAFRRAGIKGFTPIRGVSHDKPGRLPFNDILFTTEFRARTHSTEPADFDMRGNARSSLQVVKTDVMISKVVDQIVTDLTNNPLQEGEQLNLTGYSYGSVLQAHVALELSRRGVKVDNLVLVGSPIPTESELYQALEAVTNVTRVDIPGDKLSNPSSVTEYMQGAAQNLSDDGPHFDLARPGNETDQNIQGVADALKQQGIE